MWENLAMFWLKTNIKTSLYLSLLPNLHMIFFSLKHIDTLLLLSPWIVIPLESPPSSQFSVSSSCSAEKSPLHEGFVKASLLPFRPKPPQSSVCCSDTFAPLLRDFPLLTFLLIMLLKLIFPLSHLPYHSRCLARAQWVWFMSSAVCSAAFSGQGERCVSESASDPGDLQYLETNNKYLLNHFVK